MNYSTIKITGTDGLGIVSNVASKIAEIVDDFLIPFPNSFKKEKGALPQNSLYTACDITGWASGKIGSSIKTSFCVGAKKSREFNRYYLVTSGEESTSNDKHISLSGYFENNTVTMCILKNDTNLVFSFSTATRGRSYICLTVVGECIKIKCFNSDGIGYLANYSLDSVQGRLATISPSTNGKLSPDQILVGQYFYDGQNISNVYKYRAGSTVAKYIPFEIEGLGTYYANDDDFLIKV